MHTARFPLLALVIACALPAARATEPLNLQLPTDTAVTSPYRNDPPGTWYGDRSLPALNEGSERTSACPSAADGSARPVTGAVTTGFGYSSGRGSSRYNAADVHYCKEHVDDDGDGNVFNVQIHVDQYDGPGRSFREDGRRGDGPMRQHHR